jgi:hypothetical protein
LSGGLVPEVTVPELTVFLSDRRGATSNLQVMPMNVAGSRENQKKKSTHVLVWDLIFVQDLVRE